MMPTTAAESPTPSDVDSDFLRVVEPFTVFPERWLSLMAGLMQVQTFEEDDSIFRALDPSDAVYVVRKGRVTLFTDTIGEPVQLTARVNAGEMFGEVGVLEHSPRTVSARAATDAEVLRLEAADLARLGRTSRRFGARLAQRALVCYMKDSANKVELGKRSEVRIRVAREVTLEPSGQEPIKVLLDNLSRGGACLRAVPEDWQLNGSSPICMSLDDRTEFLQVETRVAWRKGSSLGLAFTARSGEHDNQVDAALDLPLGDHHRQVA